MHVLVVANETVGGRHLLERLRARAGEDVRFTVLAPINAPHAGYVVYDDTRRASAGRRLERSLAAMRAAGLRAHGLVSDEEPVPAVADALALLDPPVDEIVVSTYPEQSSGWQRRDVVEQIRKAAGEIPVEHVVVDVEAEGRAERNVLVVANETVGPALIARLLQLAREDDTRSFLIVAPQSDPKIEQHPDAERRLRRALVELRSAGVDAHAQVAHPDPYTAAMSAVRDEHVDEIVVSTFAPLRSGWLRRDLVDRLRKDSGLPVEHVVAEQTADVA